MHLTERVAEVVERFSGTLFEATQTIEEFPGLMANLEKSIDSIGSNIEDLRSSFDGFNDSSQNLIATNIEKAVVAAAGVTGGAEKISSAVEETQQIFSEFSTQLKNHTENIEIKVFDASKVFERSVNEVIVELRQAVSFLDRNSPIIAAFEDFKSSAAIENPTHEGPTLAVDLPETIATMNRQLGNSVHHSAGILGKISDIEQNFNRLTGQVANGIVSQLETLKKTSEHISSLLESYISSIQTTESDQNAKRGLFRRMKNK